MKIIKNLFKKAIKGIFTSINAVPSRYLIEENTSAFANIFFTTKRIRRITKIY